MLLQVLLHCIRRPSKRRGNYINHSVQTRPFISSSRRLLSFASSPPFQCPLLSLISPLFSLNISSSTFPLHLFPAFTCMSRLSTGLGGNRCDVKSSNHSSSIKIFLLHPLCPLSHAWNLSLSLSVNSPHWEIQCTLRLGNKPGACMLPLRGSNWWSRCAREGDRAAFGPFLFPHHIRRATVTFA